MRLAWLENWLLANDAFTFDFALSETRIKDMPVPPQQLNGKFTVVFNGDPVGKHIVVLARTGVRRLILSFYTYLDPLCYFCDHVYQKY